MADNELTAALQNLQLGSPESSVSRKTRAHARRTDGGSSKPAKHDPKAKGVEYPGEPKSPGNTQAASSTAQIKARKDFPARDRPDSQSETLKNPLSSRRPRRQGKTRRNATNKLAPTAVRSPIDQSSLANHASDNEKDHSISHIYVVQRMRPSEEVVGVYYQLQQANDRATQYLHTEHGIPAHEISDLRGLFDRKDRKAATGRATKRVWATGALEILTRGGQSWIRVLCKEWKAAGQSPKPEVVYLALDQSKRLFVVGVYATMEEAWEGCRKYWMALAICAPLENMTEAYDNQKLPHARARTMGTSHHWFVQRYDAE